MVTARALAAGLLASAALVGACKPELEGRASEVTGTRILAVRSEPAEAAPGKDVTYTSLVASADGEVAAPPLDWAFCTLPRPVAENADVSVLCFRRFADWIVPVGEGAKVSGKLPTNACRQCGPDVPEGKPGEPPGRPADPDPTGGYYQPLRVLLPEAADGWELALGQTRIACGLPGATSDVVRDFQARYRANANPRIAALELVRGGVATPLPADPDDASASRVVVAAGEAVTIRASWPACPASAVCGDGVCGMDEDVKGCPADCQASAGCGGAESYLRYDLAARTGVTTRESMRVSWYAGAGSFDVDRTGRSGDDAATAVDNVWTAPSGAAVVPLWVVLRDDRGGVDWRALRIEVR